MPLYRLSELKVFLQSVGRGANASLSQNFLIDGNIVRKIAELVPKDESVLEIGSGPGVLTEELLSRGCSIYAVEMDDVFAEQLSRLQTVEDQKALKVFQGDICKVILKNIFKEKIYIAGNIPYGISKEICLWLLSERALVQKAVLMVQKEFAQKLVAEPGTAGFGALSILMQYCFDINLKFHVAPSCFWPSPKASSTVIELVRKHSQLSAEQEDLLIHLVPKAYEHRRKKISKALHNEKITVPSPFSELHVDELGVEQWISLISKI